MDNFIKEQNFNPIRTALIGFGFSGETFHAPFLKALPFFKLTHVVSSRTEAIHKAFPECDIDIIDRSCIDNLVKNPEIDLVIITAPTIDHYDLAKEALLNGKNVVVEKPFVLGVQQGQELIDIARSKKLTLTVYHNRRWDSDFINVQSLLQTKSLGDIFLFSARYDRYRPIVNPARWKESNIVGSGILWDLGAHLIDQAHVLFGLPDAVFCDAFPQRPSAQAVDYFDIQFFYASGLRVHLSSSSLSLAPGPKYEIHGALGSYKKYGTDSQEQNLINGISPLADRFGSEATENYGLISIFENNVVVEKKIPSETGVYQDFFIKLADSIKNGASSPVAAEDALTVVQLILACEESCQQKKIIPIISR